MTWVIWILVAIVLSVVEIVTITFFPVFFSISALVAAILAAAGVSEGIQWLAFIFVGLALCVFLRPIAKRQLMDGPTRKSNVESLVGERFIVETAVDGRSGTEAVGVRGQVWSARPATDDLAQIPVGTEVIVLEVHGATLVVTPSPTQEL